MEKKELLRKLSQIEEHAMCTLAEFPKHLTKERMRMVISLTRYLRAALSGAHAKSHP